VGVAKAGLFLAGACAVAVALFPEWRGRSSREGFQLPLRKESDCDGTGSGQKKASLGNAHRISVVRSVEIYADLLQIGSIGAACVLGGSSGASPIAGAVFFSELPM